DDGKLRIRRIDRTDPQEVITSVTPLFIFWSPDSAWLGYAAAGKIWKVPADGGEGTILCDRAGDFTGGSGASWGLDGKIVFSRGTWDGLLEVPARGGDPRPFLAPDPNLETDFHQPAHLPDGSILFMPHAPGGTHDRITLL